MAPKGQGSINNLFSKLFHITGLGGVVGVATSRENPILEFSLEHHDSAGGGFVCPGFSQ